MNVYTSGDWRVRPGREDEFVAAWHELAQWTVDNLDDTGQGTLLRDSEDPSHFLSFGSWRDAETVTRWRQTDGYRDSMAKIEGMTESMRIALYDIVAHTDVLHAAR
jgi:quinol monooxygenase YgiN